MTSFSVYSNQQGDSPLDITYKSIISTGGEIEIKDFSLLSEANLLLPKDQEVNNTFEAEYMDNSTSMKDQSFCTDHVEHPYHNPGIKGASLVDDTRETSSSSQDFANLTNGCATGFTDVTWKPLVCEGDEVQISNVTTTRETVPMPHPLLTSHLEHSSVIAKNLSVLSQPYKLEHADDPYCCGANNGDVPPSAFADTARGVEDITFQSFNCAGGEIQIFDGTKPEDEAAPPLAEQISACNESSDFDPSISPHNIGEHLDHPYCNIKMDPSFLADNSGLIHQALPDLPDAAEVVYPSGLILPDDPKKNEVCTKSVSLESYGMEVEEAHGILFSQKCSSLPEGQALISPGPVDNIHCPNKKDQREEKLDKLSNKTSDMCMSQSVHKACNPPMLEKDAVLPSLQPGTELFGCNQDITSAGSCTPTDGNWKRTGPHQVSEAKDSAFGASGNGGDLCNSAEKPGIEIISGVLKVLAECPSVASVLQLGQLSPAVRKASLLLSESRKDPPVSQCLTDDSALEADKSLLGNVDIHPAGFWAAEQPMSPVPRPLFNSTTVACNYQRSLVTDPVENVDQKPCDGPRSDSQRPVVETPLIPEGPLQQQLRQMAEFLLLASGKINPSSASSPLPPPSVSTVPSKPPTPDGSNSACVGTSLIKCVEHSVNTSGQFERKRDFSAVDSCTLTDPLLWK